MTAERAVSSSGRPLAAVAVATIALAASLHPANPIGLWPATALAALVAIAVSTWAQWPLNVRWCATKSNVALGLIAGTLMALATHAVYPWAVAVAPGVDLQVVELYRRLDGPPGPYAALPILALVVFAEELVWRGIAYPQVAMRFGRSAAVPVTIGAYVLPQLGSGSWVLMLLAASCGAIWTWQRAVTGGLTAGLLTHLMWSLLVLVVFPLVP